MVWSSTAQLLSPLDHCLRTVNSPLGTPTARPSPHVWALMEAPGATSLSFPLYIYSFLAFLLFLFLLVALIFLSFPLFFLTLFSHIPPLGFFFISTVFRYLYISNFPTCFLLYTFSISSSSVFLNLFSSLGFTLSTSLFLYLSLSLSRSVSFVLSFSSLYLFPLFSSDCVLFYLCLFVFFQLFCTKFTSFTCWHFGRKIMRPLAERGTSVFSRDTWNRKRLDIIVYLYERARSLGNWRLQAWMEVPRESLVLIFHSFTRNGRN